MSDDSALDDGSGVLVPPPLDGPPDVADADGLVLRFPVEIEVRLVAPFDREQLVSEALDRLTAALEGLA
ncbi:hypothetical protein [Kutzneria buriramensis]|uniref:Uncharacterized protein n=1 Tax=Kutzneria buriramensis TaxID=1045776 RepID=A0A3E0HHS3_9PSEU|nr:hypothetical protein [Kutzneria buriramensis]REH45920.1 hypothetical protein BCF44_10752 [Kutzneria buriramensis]